MQDRFKNFTLLTSKINRCIRKIKTEEMSGFNLKSAHVSCIYYLYTMHHLTAKELCDICEEDKAAISRSLEYLEKNGFITVSNTENKKYKRTITLTKKGEEAGKRLFERIEFVLESVSEGISDEDRAVMYRTLALISDHLQNICDKYEN
ncbi:MAG: hypothetical protein E7626_07750 [Ruminococcaceae bacterium]|nr:hypothetical protein [Oscillospiraceae bacterium]